MLRDVPDDELHDSELTRVVTVHGGYWLTWVEKSGRTWNEVWSHPPYFFLIDEHLNV